MDPIRALNPVGPQAGSSRIGRAFAEAPMMREPYSVAALLEVLGACRYDVRWAPDGESVVAPTAPPGVRAWLAWRRRELALLAATCEVLEELEPAAPPRRSAC